MKLLILDKDGTLTTTVSGETFVQHPQDQRLLPNVAETLQRHAADGWTMAIASNQGGCQQQLIKAQDVKVGHRVWSTKNSYLGKVTEIKSGIFYCSDGAGYAINSNCDVLASWKTVDEAIAEMQYCLSMLPMIDCAIFAPYYDGCVAWRVWADRERLPDEVYTVTKARKPETGMLHLAASNCDVILSDAVIVGDRPEDEQAATAAGVQFQWAKDFFGGTGNQ